MHDINHNNWVYLVESGIFKGCAVVPIRISENGEKLVCTVLHSNRFSTNRGDHVMLDTGTVRLPTDTEFEQFNLLKHATQPSYEPDSICKAQRG